MSGRDRGRRDDDRGGRDRDNDRGRDRGRDRSRSRERDRGGGRDRDVDTNTSRGGRSGTTVQSRAALEKTRQERVALIKNLVDTGTNNKQNGNY